MKTKKAKKPFMSGYKHYDTRNGFGSPDEWQDAFKARMGIDKARSVLGDKNPYHVLEIALDAAWDVIQSAWRAMARKYHPDRNPGDEATVKAASDMFKQKQAAYEILEAEHNKGKR